MAWNPAPIADGDAASAASVNDVLTDGAAWINDLTEDALRRGTFNHHHAMTLFPASSPITLAEDSGVLKYTFATFGASITHTTFGADGGTETTASYTGDRAIVGHPDAASAGTYTGPLAKLTFPGLGHRLGMANGDGVGLVLVRANTQIRRIVKGQAGSDMEVMTCVQFRLDSAGTWFTIDESESFMSFSDHVTDDTDTDELLDIDIPIATLITPTMVAAAGGLPAVNYVTNVRMMTSLVNPNTGSELYINRWNLTALPLHAKLS